MGQWDGLPHANPCSCTVDTNTGEVVDYDCGDTLMHQADAAALAQFPDAAGVLERIEEKPAAPEIPLTPEDRSLVIRGVVDAAPSRLRLPNPFDGLELLGDAEDLVNHPKHYTSHPSGVECIEITRYLHSDWANAFKYVFRFDNKNGRQDLEKAIWYIEDARRHAIPMKTTLWTEDQDRTLGLVIAAERNPHRSGFFRAISIGDSTAALERVYWLF